MSEVILELEYNMENIDCISYRCVEKNYVDRVLCKARLKTKFFEN